MPDTSNYFELTEHECAYYTNLSIPAEQLVRLVYEDGVKAGLKIGFHNGVHHAVQHSDVSPQLLTSSEAKLRDELLALSQAAGGMPTTLKSRKVVIGKFVSFLAKSNSTARTVEDITTAQAAAFIASRTHSTRVCANYASALSVVFRRGERADIAAALRGKSLGLVNPRVPVCQQIDKIQANILIAAAAKHDEGAAIVLALCAEFGLWLQEAIALTPTTLQLWRKRLLAGLAIPIIDDVRGGRKRDALPCCFPDGLELVKSAQQHIQTHGRLMLQARSKLYLILRKITPSGSRISAISFRHLYITERYAQEIRDGATPHEATMIVERDSTYGRSRYSRGGSGSLLKRIATASGNNKLPT